MTALSINLNKIALIRNSRDTEYPSVIEHAQRCIDAGADGITVHPRPDQRQSPWLDPTMHGTGQGGTSAQTAQLSC